MNNNVRFSLFELNNLVKESIAKLLPDTYWVIAEISEVNEHPSGHCYLELIQKDENSDNVKAKARANIWSYTYRMLKPYFETMTNRPLSRGMKILVNTQVVFHELYGYSLNIIDIEPGYTLGDIELKRRETINRLIADGVMEMNKEQKLDILPKRVAIISSPTAAGLQDFVNQLSNNPYRYTFEHKVFPSIMQGEEAEKSIINSLANIYDSIDNFDVVVIVRGGGAQTDLSCFDSYQLASNVAQFPLPIIAGIGHDKDISVVDMVANTSVKTPTAVAEFLISKFIEAEALATDLTNQLSDITNQIIDSEKELLNNTEIKFQYYCSSVISGNIRKIESLYRKIPFLSKDIIENNRESIQVAQTKVALSIQSILNLQQQTVNKNNIKLKSLLPQKIQSEKLKHSHWSQTIHNLNPENLLQKGYSITYYNGKVLKDTNSVAIGEEVEIKLNKGLLFGNIVRKETY